LAVFAVGFRGRKSLCRAPTEQMWSLESAHPDITQFLQQSYEEDNKYRSEIRRMLMRSDAFALSLV
jgi:hypothetical protein